MFIIIFFLFLFSGNVFAQSAKATSVDYIHPGWSGNYSRGIGFSSNFTGTNTFIFDKYSGSHFSTTTFFGFAKSSNTFSKQVVNNGTTEVTTNSGLKGNAVISLARSFNHGLFRSDWTNIRIGWIVGLNYYTDAEYDVGTRTVTLSTGVTTESGWGKAKVSREPQVFTGPILSTAINLRWFPMITVGMDGGMVVFSESKVETKTKATTGAVTTTTTSKTEPGMTASTFGNGIFNLFGNFNIRYVW